MKFLAYLSQLGNPQTEPPSEKELLEDRNEGLKLVLGECGLDKIPMKIKWHDSSGGLHLFVRLSQCSAENWTTLHARSDQIKRNLRTPGISVAEIFYSHNNPSTPNEEKNK